MPATIAIADHVVDLGPRSRCGRGRRTATAHIPAQARAQADPFSVNPDGEAKLPLDAAWKPNDVLPPAGMVPFQELLRAVTAPLVPVRAVFHEFVTVWPPGRVKPRLQPLTGL